MSIPATSTLILAVVYATVGGHALLMWAGRRDDRVAWAFGMMSISVSAYALASTGLSAATTVAQAGRAQSFQLIAASFAASFYIAFCRELRGGHHPVALAFSLCLPLAASLLGMLGLLVEQSEVITDKTLGYGANLVQAELAGGGQAVQLGLLTAIGVAVLLAYGGDDRKRLRPAIWAPVLVMAAVGFDMWAEHSRTNTLYLSEYAFLGMAIAVSQRLMQRGQRVSEALRRRTKDLGESTQRLEATEQELVRREQLAAVGEISAIVAHELRNPLAIIRNAFGSLTQGRGDDRDWSALVDVVDEEADRLDRLVGDLLAYSKPLDLQPSTIAVSELLTLAAERSRRSDGSRPACEVHLRDDGGQCYADTELMCQALCNLLDNAHNAMPNGGTITLEAKAESMEGPLATVIRVADNGSGIPAALLDRVQELFFTTRPSGTGLGLAIVDRVIAAHGGSVSIDSELGHGTTVTLRMPRPVAADAMGES